MTPEQQAAAVQAAPKLIPPGTPEQTELIQHVDLRADLAAVESPTLVICTSRDPLVAPQLQRELVGGIKGAELAELATGHLVFAEDLARWLELTRGFLDCHQPHSASPPTASAGDGEAGAP